MPIEIHVTTGDGEECFPIPWFPGLDLPDVGDEFLVGGFEETTMVVHRAYRIEEGPKWIVHLVLAADFGDEEEEPGRVGW